jgi:cyanate lyase
MASSRMMIPLRSFALISPRQSGTSMMFRAKKCNYVRCYSNHDSTALAERVSRVMAAKSEAGLTYDDLAGKLGVTNTYAAQLLLGQAKLTPETATKLKAAIPSISSDDVEHMVHTFPMRTFDNDILKEPNIYRTYEAVTHYGEAMKAIINEQCGDGIMSAIDFY